MSETTPTPAPRSPTAAVRAAPPAATPAPEFKPTPRKVEPLTDVEIAQLAQQGRLHRTMEENTHARDLALGADCRAGRG